MMTARFAAHRLLDQPREFALALLGAAALSGLLAGCGASLPPAAVVQISPASVTLQAGGGTQQFTATVLDNSNTAVVWKVNNVVGGNATVGTISQAGLYSAPATVPSGTVAVEAVSEADPNASASATVTLTNGIAVTISPTSATVGASGTQQFTATVTNASNTAVTWSVNGTVGGNSTDGTISTSGLYTAPASFPGLSSVTVQAASVADTAATASATVTLTQAVTVSVSPASVTVTVGASQTFVATVTGAANTAVTWSVNGAAGGNATVGTITSGGVYTAPTAIPSPATVTVTATSAADTTVSGAAALTVAAPVTVSISPTTATLGPSTTQQFTATVMNATNTAVTWSVNGTAGGSATVGTISTGGLYTAPASFPGLSSVTVQAASVQTPAATASATVTLQQPVTVTVAPATVTVNLGATQQFGATVTGTTNTAVTWSVNGAAGGSAIVGTISTGGLYTAPTTLPSPTTVTITATSAANTAATGTAAVTLQTPPAQFTLTPSSSTLSLGKAQSGTVTLTLTLSPGFTAPVNFTVSGQGPNVTSSLSATSLTASGPLTLTLTTGSISLAATDPVVVTATSTAAGGATLTQTATVTLTITGWAGNVATLAGGPGGVGFEDGTGTVDELEPYAIASDGSANLYFADKRGTALRTAGFSAGATVTTLIGGPYNYTIGEGDGAAYDPSNNTVYVADGLRDQIFAYVLGSGDTSTILAGNGAAGYADGTGAAAQFSYPHGIAISPDDSTLYLADTSNGVIRKVDIASGAVTTLAGQVGVYNSKDGVGAAASFCEPWGLAIDPTGADLYVTDQCGYVVRQIDLSTTAVTTIAGSGAQGETDGAALSATFDQLAGVIADPHSGSNLIYVLDNNEIRGIQLGANAVFTVAGTAGPGQADGNSSQATFYSPQDLTAVANLTGSNTTTLFVADSLNGLLRRLDISNPLTAVSSGAVTLTSSTIAGQPSHRGNSDGIGTGAGYTGTSVAEFSQPEGIATDGTTAYVADDINGGIRAINLATTQVTTVAGPAQGYADGPAASAAFYEPADVSLLSSQGLLYIADAGNGAIRLLNLNTSTVSTVAGTNASGYVDGSLANARFNHPFGVLASPDGNEIYVADTGNNAIREINLSAGTVTTIAGNGDLGDADGIGSAARFSEPAGLAFDSTGNNIYISDFENEAIRELNLTTDAVTTVVGAARICGYADGPAATATLCNPAYIATDGYSLFWGDSNEGLLRVLNLTTMVVSTLAGQPGVMHMVNGTLTETPGELTGPVMYNGVFGLALVPNDSVILFADKTANVIRIIY